MLQIDDGGLAPSLKLASSHDHILVLLSLLVAVLASYSGLLLASRMSLAWKRWSLASKSVWLILGATVMGYGIWGMHFIGMLAFELPRQVFYDPVITALSGIPAILACMLPLYLILAKHRRMSLYLLAGLILGLGIAAMHFIGMAGMRIVALMRHDASLLLLSIVFALGIGSLAMVVLRAGMGSAMARHFMTHRTTFTGACIIGMAATSLHYTAMVSVNFYSQPFAIPNDAILGSSWLATGVTMVALVLGTVTAISVAVMRRLQTSADLLHVTHQQLTRAVEAIGDGVFLVDSQGRLLMCNEAFTHITGYRVDDVVGEVPSALQSPHHDIDFYEHLWDTVIRRGEWQGEIWDRRHNGEDYPARLMLSAIHYDDTDDTIHFVGTITDITERKAAADKMAELAFLDPLTHVANRRLLLDHLQHALNTSERTHSHGALLMLDLDHFKQLNDTHGHDKGDLLLQRMANRLSDCVRAGDTVCRLGGDEFVILLENLDESLNTAVTQAERVGNKIIETLLPTYDLEGVSCQITTSLGITMFGDEPVSSDWVLKQADLALYRSKEAGRNCLHFYDPDLQAAITHQHAFEEELERALQEQQFHLRFQPLVDALGNLQAIGARCYWDHPRHGMLAPSDYQADIEKHEYQLAFSEWTLEAACQQLTLWSQSAEMANMTLVVDIHAAHLYQPGFVDDVCARLSSPTRLMLQVSESLVRQGTPQTLEIMHQLKQAGIALSLHEFGQHGLPLTLLTDLPVDQLSANTHQRSLRFTSTVQNLATQLSLPLVAADVSTQSERELLISQGYQYFQGAWIGEPLTTIELIGTPTLVTNTKVS
ncbi:diguanylate cyclase domain-containing protein [Aidingimonas lacisalsi]|uniref:diguanylate cyclase domain-containing protein n=1 Tax=Aidingimonas lacisalsi TaxID=2604086 RepID=UPI001375E8C8|nr:diguanylate cyclase [Aidingimonas lacisalsi]